MNETDEFKINIIMDCLNLNSPLLAAGIGILAFRPRSDNAALYKIVPRFYLDKL
jgi:hypothetical protein